MVCLARGYDNTISYVWSNNITYLFANIKGTELNSALGTGNKNDKILPL